jgi:hypothetical protein
MPHHDCLEDCLAHSFHHDCRARTSLADFQTPTLEAIAPVLADCVEQNLDILDQVKSALSLGGACVNHHANTPEIGALYPSYRKWTNSNLFHRVQLPHPQSLILIGPEVL